MGRNFFSQKKSQETLNSCTLRAIFQITGKRECRYSKLIFSEMGSEQTNSLPRRKKPTRPDFLTNLQEDDSGYVPNRKREVQVGFTARKVMFLHLSVCPGGSLYNVTSCPATWYHVPSGGLCLVPCSFQRSGVSVRRDPTPAVDERALRILLECFLVLHNIHCNALSNFDYDFDVDA